MTKLKIREIMTDQNVARITVTKLPDQPGIVAKIFGLVAGLGMNVDLIAQTTNEKRESDVAFIVERAFIDKTLAALEKLRETIPFGDVVTEPNMAMMSIVGTGLGETPGVAAAMFAGLNEAGVNIEMISSSMITVSCVFHEDKVEAALEKLRDKFELEAPH